jgi:hypothetical protein
MRTGHQNSHKYQICKALFTRPTVGNSDGTKKVQGVLPHYFIAVHKEAGDECAHAQLIADRFCLRYRDTSLSRSSETTRTLPKTESWVVAWLEFFFRYTSELLLDVVDEDGGTACLARNGIDGRDALVAKWPRLDGGKTRALVMSSLDGNGAFASAVLGKGFPFITVVELQRSFNQPDIWCRQHGARQWSAREVVASRVRLRKIWRSDVMASQS